MLRRPSGNRRNSVENSSLTVYSERGLGLTYQAWLVSPCMVTTTDVTIGRGQVGPSSLDVDLQVPLLRMLADPIRAAILARLATAQLCVCHLQDELGAQQTLVSHHLRALREAGLVDSEPSGRFTYYRLTPGALDAVASAVGRIAAASHAQMPKRPC